MLAAGGEQLSGIFFRVNVYVVEAIDEPLDEADCQIALCCTLVRPDSSAQRFWREVTGSRRGSSRNSSGRVPGFNDQGDVSFRREAGVPMHRDEAGSGADHIPAPAIAADCGAPLTEVGPSNYI